ncbi:MAG: glycosyltransferase family 4 protein [Actinomycetia bacterium]|nr:glycosyltransferase family 4 protein [Actinomycetes bacterium]
MTSRSRVLVCSFRDLRHPAAGGAEVYTAEVLSRWADEGHEVVLFSAGVPGADVVEARDGYTVVRGGNRATLYRAARRFHATEKPFDLLIDQVNTRPFFCNEWIRPGERSAALIHQVAREVWRCQTSLATAMLGRYWLEPRWLRRIRHVPTVAISESTADSLRLYGLQRVLTCTRPTVPLTGSTQTEHNDDPKIVFVGRLVGNKRPDHAVEAFERVRRHLPRATMTIIGSGPLENRLRGLAGTGVELLGRTSSAERDAHVESADVLIVTSTREGWGLVVDEAAALGTPVFGYDTPGLRDSIGATSGILVEPRPEALAKALIEHLEGPRAEGTECRLGQDWDTLADRLWEMVNEIAEPRFGPIR